MRKELYEATIEYTTDYNGESWIATISDEKYIDMDTFERTKADLEAKLAESEKSEETYKSMFEIGVENNHSLLKEIEQLKQQLAEKEKQLLELPNKIIKRVEELSVFDFKAYEELDFRRYIISEMALDNILKEYKEIK